MFEVVKVIERHRGHFGQRKETNDVKLLQLEVFSNKITTSKIYHTNFILA